MSHNLIIGQPIQVWRAGPSTQWIIPKFRRVKRGQVAGELGA